MYRTCMISIEYYYTCFHFDTVSSVQVSPRNVQVIVICYSENRPLIVAICCGHVGTIAVMHVLNSLEYIVPRLSTNKAY